MSTSTRMTAPASSPFRLSRTPWYLSASRTGLDLQTGRVEPDAVVGNLHLTDAGEEFGDGGRVGVALAEQIEVAGGPEYMLGPGDEQHGTLEHIALGRLRLAEAEEQALDRVARQDALVVVAVLLGVSEQSAP